VYADVAKAKKGRVEVQQEKLKNQLQVIDSAMAGLAESLEDAKNDLANFEHTKEDKRKSKLEEADGHEEKASLLELVDLDKLKKKWAIIDKVQKKIDDLREQKTSINGKISKAHDSQAVDAEAIRKKRDSDIAVIDKESRTQSKAFTRTAKELQDTKNETRDLLATKRAELNPLGQQVERWESKKGEECIECEQPVPDTHVSSKLNEIETKIEVLNNSIIKINNDLDAINKKIKLNEVNQETTLAKYDRQREAIVAESDNQLADLEKSCVKQIKQLKSERESLKATISSALGKLAENTPKVTVKEAKIQNAHKDQLLDLAASLRKEAGEISLEDNPYQQLIDSLTKQLEAKQTTRKECDKKLGDFNVIFQHLHYIQRSYADRRKVKSYLIGQHIPFFNTRLYHYLDAFKLDLRISLTDSLTLTNEKWDYDYFSGGERKCFDVAFMFAVLDLHEEIHGKQCNMLVLDEVDGRLDEAFIDDLINVIKTDLASKFESIFIISHRKIMKDVFPNLLSVRRTDRLSQVFQDYAA
jgi:chromosome segregation ATPase